MLISLMMSLRHNRVNTSWLIMNIKCFNADPSWFLNILLFIFLNSKIYLLSLFFLFIYCYFSSRMPMHATWWHEKLQKSTSRDGDRFYQTLSGKKKKGKNVKKCYSIKVFIMYTNYLCIFYYLSINYLFSMSPYVLIFYLG